jgi:hypothetical protein
MDISRIRKALHEDGGAAGGTSATPGPGAIGGGIAPFKARMGTWRRKSKQTEEIDPQAPGVVQSTQHASDAQLINPMHETTHEEVILFDEERINSHENQLTPFSGLQYNDFEFGINKAFEQIGKIVDYNLQNTTDPSNRNYDSLRKKFNILKSKSKSEIQDIISSIEADPDNIASEKDLNIPDIILVNALMSAYGDNDDQEPIQYARKQIDRLLQIAKDDALETAQDVLKQKKYTASNPDDPYDGIEYLLPSDASRILIANLTLGAIETGIWGRWGEALFWNKLRKTIEEHNWDYEANKKGQAQDLKYRGEVGNEPEVAEDEPEVAEDEPEKKVAEDVNDVYPGSISRVGIPPTQPTGLISNCPTFPLQGNAAIHEELAPPNNTPPLNLGDLTVQAYFPTEQGKPTLLRYKVLKNNVPLPVDSSKQTSDNIGHTKDQVLKKLSLTPNKIKSIKKFIKYNKENESKLKTDQQKTTG